MSGISNKMSYRTRQKQLKVLKKRREDPAYLVKCKIANRAWYDRNKESRAGEAEKLRDANFLTDMIKKIQQDFNNLYERD